MHLTKNAKEKCVMARVMRQKKMHQQLRNHSRRSVFRIIKMSSCSIPKANTSHSTASLSRIPRNEYKLITATSKRKQVGDIRLVILRRKELAMEVQVCRGTG